MLTIAVRNTGEGSAVVDGLGVLSPGEVRFVNGEEQKAFEQIRGLAVTRARMPQGVVVTVAVDPTPTDEEGGN
jgi:hypothetical protein